MGEAKKKAAQLALWKQTLSADERIVLDAALCAYSNIVLAFGITGACYRLAFFLTVYLLEERGIPVCAVVGFVCDGETEMMTSHAWVELNGKKIDLALTLTEHPEAQPSGALVILNREFRTGRARYSYHSARSPDALALVERLGRDPVYRDVVRHKEIEHQKMATIAKSPELMRQFLDAAPDGLDYEALASRIRQGISIS